MRGSFIAGLTANVVLFVSSIALVHWGTRDAFVVDAVVTDTPFAQQQALAHDARPAAPSISLVPPAFAASGTHAIADASDAIPAVPAPTGGTAPAPTVAELHRSSRIHRVAEEQAAPRRRALRDFRLELRDGVAALRARVSPCSVSGTTFDLAVESVEGGVRILSATTESSAAQDSGIACVQAALRGQMIHAPSIEPGRRWHMPFAVGS